MSEVLTLLKAGIEREPLFLAHGMGGSVNEFCELVKFLPTERPIYGLQAKGNDGVEEPFELIEDLADYFLDAIKKVQPRGPYLLMGYSLGGLVALEIAQRLSSKGEIVALLGMIDSYPHPHHLSLWQRIRLAARGVKGRVSSTAPASSVPKPKSRAMDNPVPRTDPPSVTSRARQTGYVAWKQYRPRFYDGRICFVRAAISTIYPDDPIAVWSKFALKVEVRTVPGNHHGILAEHFEVLGSVLSEYLRDANLIKTS